MNKKKSTPQKKPVKGSRSVYETILGIQHRTAVSLSLAETVNDAFKILMEGICATGEFDSGGSYLYRDDVMQLELIYHFGLGDDFVNAARVYKGNSHQVGLVLGEKPLYADSRMVRERVDGGIDMYRTEGLCSFAVVPLRYTGKIIGSLNIASHSVKRTSPPVMEMIETMAMSAASIIHRLLSREQLQAAKNNLDTLFNAIDDFIFIVDAGGLVIETNDVVQRRLGYALDEVRRMSAADFHPPARREEAAMIIGEMLMGRRDLCLIPLMAKKGELIPVETRIVKGRWDGKEVLFGVSRDITERRRIENALRASEKEYEDLVESIPIGVYRVKLQDNGIPRFIYVSPRVCEMTGLSKEVYMGDPYRAINLVHPAYSEDFIRRNLDAYHTKEPFEWEGPFLVNGKTRYMHIESCPVTLENGEVVWNGIQYDITDRITSAEALRQSEWKYRFITENMNDIVWTTDLSFRTTYVSPSIEKVLGFTPEERMRQSIQEQVTCDSYRRIQERLALELRREAEGADPDRSISIEVEYLKKDGTILWMESDVLAMRDDSGGLLGLYGVSRDISEQKRAELDLRSSLEEKEVLLNEVHHRVKNNLQIISSLINLQKGILEDNKSIAALGDLQGRIMAMASVHEMLYKSGSFTRVSLKEYIEEVSLVVDRTLSGGGPRVTIDCDLEEGIEVSMEKAIPIGLIVNELITNSLKHAQREGEAIIIRMELRQQDGAFRLRYRDNGPGLPPGFDLSGSETMGMTVINTLVRQLKATMEAGEGEGMSLVITCPLGISG